MVLIWVETQWPGSSFAMAVLGCSNNNNKTPATSSLAWPDYLCQTTNFVQVHYCFEVITPLCKNSGLAT